MAYVKQIWTDRQVEKPLTFNSMTNADGTITLSPAPGKITQAGTLVTADRMNHIENGIGDLDSSISNLSGTVNTLSVQVGNSKAKGDFAIVTGEMTTPAAGSENITTSVTIGYPTGFNKNNCVIVSLMSKNNTISTEDKRQWSTMGLDKSLSVLKANSGLTASLRESDIVVIVRKVDAAEESKKVGVRLVLMKIS